MWFFLGSDKHVSSDRLKLVPRTKITRGHGTQPEVSDRELTPLETSLSGTNYNLVLLTA